MSIENPFFSRNAGVTSAFLLWVNISRYIKNTLKSKNKALQRGITLINNEMKIKLVNINEITPYENNPRYNENAVVPVANSIKEFGFKQPIIVDADGVIIAGHTRLKASKYLGLEKVPVLVADDLTPDQVKAFRIADNKVGELATWDYELLNIELDDIELDMSAFDIEISAIDTKENETATEDDFEPKPPEEPTSKYGQIYQLGNHRLMCGDSTNTSDINRLLNGANVDMIFTDPPYNVSYNGRSGNFDVIKNDNLSDADFNNFISKTVEIIKKINPPIYYIWCNWKFYGILHSELEYKNCIVWAKNVFGLGNGYRHQHEFCLFNGSIDETIKNETDLWEIKKDVNYVHPTQKPVELSFRALRNHKNANNILDLFGGSGSTLIGCEQAGRNCFMMELDPKYVDVIIERWERYTGNKSVLVNE